MTDDELRELLLASQAEWPTKRRAIRKYRRDLMRGGHTRPLDPSITDDDLFLYEEELRDGTERSDARWDAFGKVALVVGTIGGVSAVVTLVLTVLWH